MASVTTKHPWYPVWSTAIQTGMRNGELYALLWDDVDLRNREITVNKSYNCRIKKVKSTKAGYWRTIPISNEFLGFLTELKGQSGDRKEVLPRLPRWGGDGGLFAHKCWSLEPTCALSASSPFFTE